MKLQIALDDITLGNAVNLIAAVRENVDIIEIGTPMVIEYGMNAVRAMKENFPEIEVLADLKIMDAGYYEASQAFKAGADYITVLGVTDNLTIKNCVDAAKEYGGQVVVDMICVSNMEERIHKMEELGVDYLSVHVGVDQQAEGRTPLDDLKIMKNTVTDTKISVAGGISLETIEAYKELKPDVVIVGGGIAHSNNPKEAAKALYQAIQ